RRAQCTIRRFQTPCRPVDTSAESASFGSARGRRRDCGTRATLRATIASRDGASRQVRDSGTADDWYASCSIRPGGPYGRVLPRARGRVLRRLVGARRGLRAALGGRHVCALSRRRRRHPGALRLPVRGAAQAGVVLMTANGLLQIVLYLVVLL